MKIHGQIKSSELKSHNNFEPIIISKLHIIIPSVNYSKNERVNYVTFSYILFTCNPFGNFNVLQELDGNFDFIHFIRLSKLSHKMIVHFPFGGRKFGLF